jgi:hypothetical protein
MKIIAFALALVAAVFPIAESRADNCQYTFRCQGSICERVLSEACSPNTSQSNVTVVAPSSATTSSATTFTAPSADAPAANQAFIGSEQRTFVPPAAPVPPSGAGCAENGSCYGDISNINGMPKTNQVNGYFRRDGTYVRGHYRSSGRR